MGEHWYDRDGNPRYEVKAASGFMRPTTLADAKKEKLVPSVTTILAVIDKPALTNWKVDQGILAALTLPRNPDEQEASYIARIKADSGSQAREAALEGSRIHDAVESHFKGEGYPERYKPHVDACRRKLWEMFPGVTDWVSEKAFCHSSGYGGKVDIHSPNTGIVADIKGKDGDFSDGKKLAYDQHYQLAAYQRGLGLHPNVCANLFVSRTHPGAVSGHEWSVKQMKEGLAVFDAAFGLWKALRKYDPATDNAASRH